MAIGAVILAAGAATRMGKLKQLLPYRGRPLLVHAIDQAARSGFAPIITVLGAGADDVRAVLHGVNCQVVVNENWASGMGSSLKIGVGKLLEVAPEATAVGALLADQPRITVQQLAGMLRVFEEAEAPIVAAEYNGFPGVPAIFCKSYFPVLLSLAADAGARHLLRDAGAMLQRYPLPEAAIDVDTPEDYASLI